MEARRKKLEFCVGAIHELPLLFGFLYVCQVGKEFHT